MSVLPLWHSGNTTRQTGAHHGRRTPRRSRSRQAPHSHDPAGDQGPSNARAATLALRIARNQGLLDGPKIKHFNAKVPPRLFDAAAKRLGTNSPAVVIQAALAVLATQDDLGTWLARNLGVLADLDPALLAQLDI
jgi:hypothetical protein